MFLVFLSNSNPQFLYYNCTYTFHLLTLTMCMSNHVSFHAFPIG